MTTLGHEEARTLAIVHELAKGKRLTLKDGKTLAMGDDMTIGFVVKQENTKTKESTEKLIQPLDGPIDLACLNDLLNKNEIWHPIPNTRELFNLD